MGESHICQVNGKGAIYWHDRAFQMEVERNALRIALTLVLDTAERERELIRSACKVAVRRNVASGRDLGLTVLGILSERSERL